MKIALITQLKGRLIWQNYQFSVVLRFKSIVKRKIIHIKQMKD